MSQENIEKTTEYKFRPVRCTEEKLKSITPLEGSLYFTLDTKKIFLAKDKELIQMCENKGFFYGTKKIDYNTGGNTPDPNVEFYLEEIEGELLPEVDDLILNIDGCFYRVKEQLDEYSVRTVRLTLQGTGTGGSGGDTGTSFLITAPSGRKKTFSAEVKEAYIDILAKSSDSTNYISGIEISYNDSFSSIFHSEYDLRIPLETKYSINLIKYLKDMGEGTKIYVRALDSFGMESGALSYSIEIVRLSISTDQDYLFGVSTNSFDYVCSIGGTASLDKTLVFELEDVNGKKSKLLESPVESSTTEITKTLDLSSVEHGEYTLRVYTEATATGNIQVKSNILIHKMLRYDSKVGTPIFSALVPEVTEQYTDIPIKYLLVYGNTTQSYLIDFIVNGNLETTQVFNTGKISEYILNFDRAGTYELDLRIEELKINYPTIILNISKYTGNLPNIDIDNDALKVYLNPKGRTNDASDKDKWPNYVNSNQKGTLSDFYFRTTNGWMRDENKINYLKVNQGAKVDFKDYSPFGDDTNPTKNGITIELDFKLSGILDYSKDNHLIECLSYYPSGEIKTGFFITGNSFNYWASGKELFTMDLVENQRIRLTFVLEAAKNFTNFPMCYTYLNGILSNAYNYKASDDFANSVNKGYLKIDSTYGQVDIYGIRFYSMELNSQTVLKNYQASLSPLELRQENYEDNLIRDDNGNISLNKIESSNYKFKIPYVKILGGYMAMDKKQMTMADESDSNKPALPRKKDDFRNVDIEIHYPKYNNPYFKDYPEVWKVTTTFDDSSLNVLNGFGETPTEAAVIYAQGTSSLEYPVKNLRAKFKNKTIKVRPDLPEVNLVCFKADYMESSGSHNTGAANFIDDAYKAISIATPAQKHYSDEKIVTCIKGHPCVIFWSPTGEKDSYQYIGKYNLNLDKATPEPFGFKNDDSNFGYEVDEDGELILDENGEKINSIYCFEFLDNKVKVCNFLSDEESNKNPELTTEKERYEDTWYGKRVNKDGDIVPGWAIGFESRYPEDKVGDKDADALWPLANWLNSLYEIYQQELNEGKKPEDIEYEYEYTIASSFDENKTYYIKVNDDYIISYPNSENFLEQEYYTRKIVNTQYAMTSIRRFRDEYQEYLDPDFLLAYYIITEVLLMADSRVKNMMIATWGKEHRTFKLTSGEEKTVFNYIWYPIFYDMDTMLGLNNEGHKEKEYYYEDTSENTFNGDEVLWKLVRDALPSEITVFYNQMEQASATLTENNILPYFNKNQASMANETFYNEDAIYKYINPFRTGYYDDLEGKNVEPGTGERLYAAQGSRDMMREYFLKNRMRYLRGKRNSSIYQSGDRIEFRISYPKKELDNLTEEQEKINASIEAVKPSSDFNLTANKIGFAGVKVGANGVPISKRFLEGQSQVIEANTSGADGTEAYILGVSNLSDIGDLSDKYIHTLVIGAIENRLKTLKLGNHNQNYYNPYWKNANDINLKGFNYLEEFNLENCSAFKGDVLVSNCQQIKKIILTGSNAKSLALPLKGIINELRIPPTINNLSIDSHSELVDEKFTIGYYDYENETYVNDYSKLIHVKIIDTPIDSYSLIKGAINAEKSNFESFCLQGINWNITDINDVELNDKNEVIGIKVLDALSNLNPYTNQTGLTKADCLMGTITVNVGNNVIDEFSLYEKYQKVFPNVELKYISENLKPAYVINFYNSETIIGNPQYVVRANGETNLSILTSADGPAGVALPVPKKPQDERYVYTFNNIWTVAESEDSDYPVGSKILVDNFAKITPKGNMSFTANYTSSDRLYKVIFYDEDGTTELINTSLVYEANVEESLKDYSELIYNYKEYKEAEQNPHNHWVFKGWQTAAQYEENSTEYIFSLSDKVIENDFIMYAYYEVEDARTYPTNLSYFNIPNQTQSYGGYGSGYVISIKPELKEKIQGKITLPNKTNDGRVISYVGDFAFADCTKLKDVYFIDNEDNKYIGIGKGGFAMTKENQLSNVYLPKNSTMFKIIYDYAFQNCYNLLNIDITEEKKLNDNIEYIGDYAFGIRESNVTIPINYMQVNIKELPKNLKILEDGAFYRNLNLEITTLPIGLTRLGIYSLASCDKVNIIIFGTNELGKGLQIIDEAALKNSGKSITTIEIHKSITNLATNTQNPVVAAGAFTNYGNISSIKYYKPISEIKDTSDSENQIADWQAVGIPAGATEEGIIDEEN